MDGVYQTNVWMGKAGGVGVARVQWPRMADAPLPEPRSDGGDATSLGELVFRALEGQELEGEGAIEALFRQHPEHAADLRRRLALIADLGLRSEAEAPAREHPERL